MNATDATEPRLLRAFVAVAEELHFGRAAARLHISQPPLSVQIRTLEERLGAQLLVRDRRHVALTEAGAFFLDRAKQLLAEGERSCAEAARIARGEAGALSVGYTSTATYEVLPPAIRRFHKRWPDVRLELIEIRSPLQAEALEAGRIEIGFACGPVDHAGVVQRVLVTERFVVALPRHHRLSQKARLRLRDLTNEPFVAVRPDIEPAWADACDRALHRAGVRVHVAQETDSKMALLGLVAAALGIAVVSASMREVARRGVVYRELVDFPIEVPLVALTLERPSPRAVALLREVAPEPRVA